MPRLLIYFMSICTIVATGCSSSPKKDSLPEIQVKNEPSREATYVAVENGADYVSEITFERGSAELRPEAKENLKRILEDAIAQGKIEGVKIASWADKEYPSKDERKLTESDRKLARKRNRAITSHLRDVAKAHKTKLWVDTYNMAERPSSLENLIGTSDARLKRSLESAGIRTTAPEPGKTASKSSKGLVMVIIDEVKTE